MTNEQVHAFLERFRVAWLEQDLESISDCYIDNCEVVSPIFHTVRGRSALENSYRDAFKAFIADSPGSIVPRMSADNAANVRGSSIATSRSNSV